jgi:site-specific recombinase XerD
MNALVATATELEPISLDEAFENLLRLRVARGDPSPDTLNTYRREAQRFLAWVQARGVPVWELTEEDVLRYRAELIASGYRPSTIALRLSVVRRVLQAVVYNGLAARNAAEHVKSPKDPASAEERANWLSEAELAVLFSRVDPTTAGGRRDRAMLGLMALHGLRTVEVQRLNVGDHREQGGVPALYVRGKSRKDRWVYLRDDVDAALQEWRAELRDVDSAAPLFVVLSNRARGARLTRRGIRKIVDRHLAAARLKRAGGRTATAHGLRASYATAALRAGATLEQIAAEGGWRVGSASIALYAHITDRVEQAPSRRIRVQL